MKYKPKIGDVCLHERRGIVVIAKVNSNLNYYDVHIESELTGLDPKYRDCVIGSHSKELSKIGRL